MDEQAPNMGEKQKELERIISELISYMKEGVNTGRLNLGREEDYALAIFTIGATACSKYNVWPQLPLEILTTAYGGEIISTNIVRSGEKKGFVH